jgi:hypothetical protein
MIRNQAAVTVTGWLNNPKKFEWGSAAKLSVDQRRKNDQGIWETVDKTEFDVTFDGDFPDAKQITVQGRITGTNVFERRDGSSGFSIKVRADNVIPAEPETEDAPF